jgi:glycine/D-amino acid oxidase-like deaminating enzyme
MKVTNDNSCSWIKDLNPRQNIKLLTQNLSTNWLIIGAGFTGLSAARKLGEIFPKEKILIIDAQLAGEGASGRNSGYLVDTTLNDGFTSNKDLESYKKKADIYDLGINAVKNFIKEYQVECDWNECGKYFASSKKKDLNIINKFSKTLEKLGYEHNILDNYQLTKKLGTSFYNIGLYTKGGILLHPGKLVRAMIDTLPKNVKLYENSPIYEWYTEKDFVNCRFQNGIIKTKKIIFATNGFLRSLGIKKNYNFPLTLTASMTRPLTSKEYLDIGSPKEWGVLSVRPMGATVRMTKDKRILIRNTAELSNPFKMTKMELDKRADIQRIGIKKRFPQLPDDIIESSWSGVVSRTRNSSQIFEKIDDNIFVAGCYNGSGIGVGTLFGEQIAIKSIGENSKEIDNIELLKKAKWLPPNPLLNFGIKTKLYYERLKAISEI